MTLWTPDGERRIPPIEDKAAQESQSASTPSADADPGSDANADLDADLDVDLDAANAGGEDLSPEDAERARAMAHELAEARARLLETEVGTVLANHALGIYELGAIHLTADEPDFPEAKLAIDALSALVEATDGRLGDAEATLKEALHQVKLAYVTRLNDSKKPSQ